jgi:hypothetical protein
MVLYRSVISNFEEVLRELQRVFPQRSGDANVNHPNTPAFNKQPTKQPVGFWEVGEFAPHIVIFLALIGFFLVGYLNGDVEEGKSWTLMGPLGIILRDLFGFNIQTLMGL